MKTEENTQDSKAETPEDLLYCNYAATVLLTIIHFISLSHMSYRQSDIIFDQRYFLLKCKGRHTPLTSGLQILMK